MIAEFHGGIMVGMGVCVLLMFVIALFNTRHRLRRKCPLCWRITRLKHISYGVAVYECGKGHVAQTGMDSDMFRQAQ